MVIALRQAMQKVRRGIHACQSEPVWPELAQAIAPFGAWAQNVSADEASGEANPTALSGEKETSPLEDLAESLNQLFEEFVESRRSELEEVAEHQEEACRENLVLAERATEACPVPLGLPTKDRNRVWGDAKAMKGGLFACYKLWRIELASDGSVSAVHLVTDPPYPDEFQRCWGAGWAGEVGGLRGWLQARAPGARAAAE